MTPQSPTSDYVLGFEHGARMIILATVAALHAQGRRHGPAPTRADTLLESESGSLSFNVIAYLNLSLGQMRSTATMLEVQNDAESLRTAANLRQRIYYTELAVGALEGK